jgi:hypothetical protein
MSYIIGNNLIADAGLIFTKLFTNFLTSVCGTLSQKLSELLTQPFIDNAPLPYE